MTRLGMYNNYEGLFVKGGQSRVLPEPSHTLHNVEILADDYEFRIGKVAWGNGHNPFEKRNFSDICHGGRKETDLGSVN